VGTMISTEDRVAEEIHRERVCELCRWMQTLLSKVSPRAAEELVKGAVMSLAPSLHDAHFAEAGVFCDLIRSEVLEHPKMLGAIIKGKREARERFAKR